MRQLVIKILKPLDGVSVENSVGPGTPDINYMGGWIELKWLRSWPKKADTIVVLDHELEMVQIAWARKRINRGGRSWVMLQANRTDWLIWPGNVAGEVLGFSTRQKLIETALVHYWTGSHMKRSLVKWLQNH